MSTALAKKEDSTMSTLASYVTARKSELAKVLPRHMTPERVLKIALAACSRNQKLLQCTPESIYSSLHTASQLGLEPGGPLGAAYLVPYFNSKTGKNECQFQVGYRGLIDLARRSGQISTIFAYAIKEGDVVEFELGLEPKLKHIPSAVRGEITHVYAVAHLRDGGKQFVVMTKAEVDAIRGRSKTSGSGPWETDYEQMALKTVIKRLVKYLPMSVDLSNAIESDGSDDEVPTAQNTAIIETIDANTGEIIDTPVKTRTTAARKMIESKLKNSTPPEDTINEYEQNDDRLADEAAPISEDDLTPPKQKNNTTEIVRDLIETAVCINDNKGQLWKITLKSNEVYYTRTESFYELAREMIKLNHKVEISFVVHGDKAEIKSIKPAE